MSTFAETWREPSPVDEAVDEWIALHTSSLGNAGYHATMQGERTIAYRRRHTPGIAIFVGLITFPLGILAWLLWKAEDVFTVHFEAAGEDTTVTAKGEAKPAVVEKVRTVADDARRILAPEPTSGW